MNWLRYKKIYFAISGILITATTFSLLNWRLVLGVDFSGGSVLEYRFTPEVSTEEVTSHVEELGIEVQSVQITSEDTYFIRTSAISASDIESVTSTLDESEEYEEVTFLRAETVGPSIGPELIKKTFYAAVIAAVAILLWVAYQFKSLIFGSAAIIAMLHDTFILVGSFALLGHFMDAQVDFLFVTAVLTTLSFSVHDTIVVFDRVREIMANEGGELTEVANRAVTETMVRSLNNSFTIIFMLVALVLLGGITVRWFAVALLIGTVLGTYSSPFVAVPVLVTLKDFMKNLKEKKLTLNLTSLFSKK